MIITDLPTDVLQDIAVLLVASPDGLKSFALARAVSKKFKGLMESGEVLKVIRFDERIKPSYLLHFKRYPNDIFHRSACLRNTSAQFFLGKELLKCMNSSRQDEAASFLWKFMSINTRRQDQAASFLREFLFEHPTHSSSVRTFVHVGEIMRTYILHCNPQEILVNYDGLLLTYSAFCGVKLFVDEPEISLVRPMTRLRNIAAAIRNLRRRLSSWYDASEPEDLYFRFNTEHDNLGEMQGSSDVGDRVNELCQRVKALWEGVMDADNDMEYQRLEIEAVELFMKARLVVVSVIDM